VGRPASMLLVLSAVEIAVLYRIGFATGLNLNCLLDIHTYIDSGDVIKHVWYFSDI